MFCVKLNGGRGGETLLLALIKGIFDYVTQINAVHLRMDQLSEDI